MSKTISTSTTGPVTLAPADNPLTITSTGTVTSTGTYGIGGAANTTWTITNYGAVASVGGDGISLAGAGIIGNSGAISGVDGLVLRAGGTVSNLTGGSISASGTVGSGLGVGAGVYITGASGTVTNNATISGGGYGVGLADGGMVTNTASILGGEDGVIFEGALGTLVNSGNITGTVDDGVALFAGGSVTNNAGASISGLGSTSGAGVFITGAAGTVTNNGSIAGVNHNGVLFTTSGSLTNAAGASISGFNSGVFFGTASAGGTVTNSGTITATANIPPIITNGTVTTPGTYGTAIDMEAGGSITNKPGGSISGIGFGVFITGAAGTVANSGNITSTKYSAVDLTHGGSVTNAAGASIVGGSNGVAFGTAGTAGTVTNSGNISASGAAVYLQNGGSVTNNSAGTISGKQYGAFLEGGPGTIANQGSISGATGDGIVLGLGGAVTNAASASISGANIGVYVKYRAAGTVTNSGNISASAAGGAGVELADGGIVTNYLSGSISGTNFGVFVPGTFGNPGTVANPGTVVNDGRITSTKYGGVNLGAGGSVTNATGASIVGGSNGVSFGTVGVAGTVTNSGSISATATGSAGVDLGHGGSVTNKSFGFISGTSFGVFVTGGSGTVTNAGTISGASGTAVSFAGGGNRVVVDPGAVFSGLVYGGTGGDTLELAPGTGSGTFPGLGAQFIGFTTVTVDAGASWQFTGALSDPGTTLVNAGTISGAVDFAGSGNRVVVDAGAAFSAGVNGGDTLELAAGGNGSLSGLGSQFTGFTTVTVDAGASWQLAGANTIAAGTALTDAGALINAGTLVNAGHIAATGAFSDSGALTNGGAITGAVTLTAGGSLANLASGVINGSVLGASAETLVNAGRIGAGGTAVAFTGGGNRVVVDPGAVFSGVVDGGTGNDTLELAAGNGSLSGLGTQFTGFTTVTVDAGASWQLAGVNTIAAGAALTDAGALINAGTLTDAGTLLVSNVLTNTGSIAATGAFSDSGALTNSGAITGAVTLTAGGSLANLSSGVVNGPVLGTSAETLVNAGAIGAVSFAGGNNLVVVDPGASFSGTVNGGSGNDTLELAAGNGSLSGLGTQFTGFTTVAVDAGASWQLAGANTIAAGTALGDAGTLVNAGALVNDGTIVATGAFGDSGALTNSGTITGTVALTAGGSLTNLSSGVVNGPVLGDSAETLVNAGAIGAVSFTGGGNRVVVDPGAVFSGVVDGGTGNDTLELAAGNGSLSGLGSQFTGFTTVAVDAGASWQVSGGDAAPSFINDGTVVVGAAGLVLGAVSEDGGAGGTIDIGGTTAEFAGSVAAGQALVFTAASGLAKLDQPGGFAGAIQNFQAGDILDLSGVVANGASYGNGVLSLTDNGTTVDTLALSTPYRASAQNPGGNPAFTLASDGNGGTLVSVVGDNNILAGTYTNGIVLSNPATQNPLIVTATGYVANTGNAIYGEANAAWTIENLGTISGNGNAGTGISLAAGGTVTNGQSGATGALISGYYNGIVVSGAPGTVVNYGSVLAGQANGVYLAAGGSVTNHRGASIDGYYNGIVFGAGGPGAVVNDGKILGGTGTGVYLAAGGTVTNHGVIRATAGYYNFGVALAGPGTVVNGASNNHGALIAGYYGGIVFTAPHGTLVNYGRIDGTAVYFSRGHDLVVDHPGARFVGYVSAGVTQGNTLELAAGAHSGAIADLYGQFAGFTAAVQVDPGAAWRLSDSGSYGTFSFTNDGTIQVGGSPFAFGAVYADPHQHGRIDVGNNTVEFTTAVGPRETVAFNGNAGTVQLDDPQDFHGRIAGFGGGDTLLFQQQLGQPVYAGGTLTVTAADGATLANIAVSGNYSSSEFQLTPDHHGIMLANST
jgi:hypothetical protein